ncbi:glucokinase [Prosthecomicrobium sp. N25]|uniref:glucokinase n=1 Tax=Prosthecomicrobium sp. N25 TaxID=3129254 RepID=UPI003077BAD6
MNATNDAAASLFPVLIADIGGTNARFATVADPHAEPEFLPPRRTAAYADPILAIESLGLSDEARAPRSAIMAIAAPVTSDEITLTNCPWTIAPRRMIARLGFRRVALVNDFEAQALALPALKLPEEGAGDLLRIGGGEPRPDAAKVVIGPGTGLGVASLVHAMGRWVPVPGEGGHVTLGPETEREIAIWRHVERIGGRVTAEAILSGSGILRLARAVAAADGKACPHAGPEAVTAAADAGEPIAVETLRIFAACLGRLAGDFALSSLARGGVYIAGGVAPKIEHWLTDGTFRSAFEDKAPHQELVSNIPTYLVKHPQSALVGLAALARKPQRYAIELEGRVWTV